MLDLVVLLLAGQELFSAATGRDMLDAHMDALWDDPVANLHTLEMCEARLYSEVYEIGLLCDFAYCQLE